MLGENQIRRSSNWENLLFTRFVFSFVSPLIQEMSFPPHIHFKFQEWVKQDHVKYDIHISNRTYSGIKLQVQMFVCLPFTVWVGNFIISSKIWFSELWSGYSLYLEVVRVKWESVFEALNTVPVILWVLCKVFVIIDIDRSFNQQSVQCPHIVGNEDLFVHWMNAHHLCWGFWKTWSLFCGAEH